MRAAVMIHNLPEHRLSDVQISQEIGEMVLGELAVVAMNKHDAFLTHKMPVAYFMGRIGGGASNAELYKSHIKMEAVETVINACVF